MLYLYKCSDGLTLVVILLVAPSLDGIVLFEQRELFSGSRNWSADLDPFADNKCGYLHGWFVCPPDA